ncbi:hypothetical protein [Pseudozobellia thermophila]|uniref:HPt domain-containing protein n=1 Tax=Pseudozobellia thermophila TaxID=192903 RepID=A0A1M6I2I5_9FLAO|nr:hypothetical protein [Pseudozobellia thermophila]SHJ28666.1 hypothetical protein SAMN04488513_103300 [Pseudozobellia thermophila]
MQVLPNIDYIKQLAGDDLEFEQQFISILKDEFPIEHQEYLDHVENDRYKETALIVHKINHKFNILGLEESYHFAQQYEADLKLENTDKETEFKEILNLVGDYITKL